MKYWPVAALLFVAFANAQAEEAGPLRFSAAQADHGKSVYAQACATCHGAGLEGGPGGPPLTGVAFLRRWEGQPGDALLNFIQAKMPPTGPGSVGQPGYTDLLA